MKRGQAIETKNGKAKLGLKIVGWSPSARGQSIVNTLQSRRFAFSFLYYPELQTVHIESEPSNIKVARKVLEQSFPGICLQVEEPHALASEDKLRNETTTAVAAVSSNLPELNLVKLFGAKGRLRALQIDQGISGERMCKVSYYEPYSLDRLISCKDIVAATGIVSVNRIQLKSSYSNNFIINGSKNYGKCRNRRMSTTSKKQLSIILMKPYDIDTGRATAARKARSLSSRRDDSPHLPQMSTFKCFDQLLEVSFLISISHRKEQLVKTVNKISLKKRSISASKLDFPAEIRLSLIDKVTGNVQNTFNASELAFVGIPSRSERSSQFPCLKQGDQRDYENVSCLSQSDVSFGYPAKEHLAVPIVRIEEPISTPVHSSEKTSKRNLMTRPSSLASPSDVTYVPESRANYIPPQSSMNILESAPHQPKILFFSFPLF